jgi:sarcosine oxidase gamma subunit
VADLRTGTPSVTSVLASADACDRVGDLPGAYRVSPVEVAIVGGVSAVAVRAAVARLDPDAVVLDVSDGWAALTLDGPGSREAFARLSELELPDAGAIAGEVARVGVRVIVEGDRIDLLVPSMVASHVRERIESDCAELLR